MGRNIRLRKLRAPVLCTNKIIEEIGERLQVSEDVAVAICEKINVVLEKIEEVEEDVAYEIVEILSLTYGNNGTVRGTIKLYKIISVGEDDISSGLKPVLLADFKFNVYNSSRESVRVFNIVRYD